MTRARFSYSLGIDRSDMKGMGGENLTSQGAKDFEGNPVPAILAQTIGRALRSLLSECGPYDVNELAAEFRNGLENK